MRDRNDGPADSSSVQSFIWRSSRLPFRRPGWPRRPARRHQPRRSWYSAHRCPHPRRRRV